MFSFFLFMVPFLAFHVKPPADLSTDVQLGSAKEQAIGHMATVCP